MSKSIIRLLLGDDSADEAESLSNALRQAGYVLKTRRIEDLSGLETALAKETWDTLVCKAGLPRLKIDEAQQVLRRHPTPCTLLLVAKKFTVEEIRQAMAMGVRDVFLQGDWLRLGPAIEREIETCGALQLHVETAESLRQLENRYRVMIENSQEAVAYCHDGVYVDANPAYLDMVGCASVEDLRTIPVLNLIDRQDHVRFKSWLRKPNSHEGAQEFLALGSDGRSFAAEIVMSPIHLGDESCVQIFVRDISKRKVLEVKLQYLHQRDALTGIFNRPYFLQELSRALEQTAKTKTGTHLVGVEVPGVKGMNQKIGHAACDRMLISIARCLREHADKDHLLARTGGGQFSILLGGKNAAENQKFIESLRATVSTVQFKDGGNTIPLNIVLKHAEIDGSVTDREALLNLVFATETQEQAPAPNSAASAVSAAVNTSTPQKTDPPHAPETATSQPPVTSMVKPAPLPAQGGQISVALENNSMELLFQPIVNLHGEAREYFEALPAIQTSDGDMLGADSFMPSALQSGEADKVDRWLMQKSIEHLAKKQKEGQATSLFVSLSAGILADTILLQAVRQHLKATRLDPGRLYLQLSAAVLKDRGPAVRSFVTEARQIGLNVVLTDMDSRHITAEELTGMDIAYIAIDCRSGADNSEGAINEGLLRNTVALAKKLGAATIARRVENAEVFSLLWGAGVDYIQGDYLAPALTSPDHHFTEEQTLSSDVAQPAFNFKAAG